LDVILFIGFVTAEKNPDPAMSQIISRIGCDLRTGTAKTDRKMQLNAFSN